MKIVYVGGKPRQRDRLFGTGLAWHGHGDVQEVADAEIAQRMVEKHPDVWAVAPDQSSSGDSPGQDLPRSAPAPGQDITPPGDGEGLQAIADGLPSFDDIQIEVDGEWVLLKKARKEAIEAYTLAHFGENLDRRKTQTKLAERLYELITEDHAKRAAEAAEQTGDESEGEPGDAGTEQGEEGGDAA